MRFHTVAPWTQADDDITYNEGWGLFNIESDPVIQKDDDLGVFASDDDAIDYVTKWARAGSLVHARALQLHMGAVTWDFNGAYADADPSTTSL